MRSKTLQTTLRRTVVALATIIAPAFGYSQTISTIVGTGVNAATGDGGPATAATIGESFGIVTDKIGNVYFADASHNKIRKIDTFGIVTTIAGTGTHAYGGDGGPATAADLAFPSGIAFDKRGNLYISDANNNRVRKVDTLGIITTFAGTGTYGYSGDGGPATAAQMGYSDGVFVDKYGRVIVPDPPNDRIRMVDTTGIITTIAGNGIGAYSGDGGPATAASLENPADVFVDRNGTLFFTDFTDNYIRTVDAAGIINTICGTGMGMYSGDAGPATAASVNGPVGIYVDGCGNVYIGDRSNNRVRFINTSGVISTIAGTGTSGSTTDGVPATAANLSAPHGVHVDNKGNIYIADRYNYRIRKISTTNHLPAFSSGASSSAYVVAATAKHLDTILAATDADLSQTLTWTVSAAPAHGTLSGFPATLPTTGSTVYTSGLMYTPTTGYLGADTFKVFVADCFATREITVYATVHPGLGLSSTLGMAGALQLTPNPANGRFTVRLSTHEAGPAHVIVTNILGEVVKEQDIIPNQPTEVLVPGARGMYLIAVHTAQGVAYARLLLAE